MTTQTLEVLSHAVTVSDFFNVVAFTMEEYFTPEDLGVKLSRPDDDDVMYLAMLQKGDMRVIRGNLTLRRADVARALNKGWTVWVLRTFVQPHHVYVLSDIDVIARHAEAQVINDLMELEGSAPQVALLTDTGATAKAALERYFAGE